MSESLYPMLSLAMLCFALFCLFLLWYSVARNRSLQTLVNQNIYDFNQLLAQHQALIQEKNHIEQQCVKAETQAEGLQIRLNERDEKILYLQTELNEEQARHSQVAAQITTHKEQYGIACARIESLNHQSALQHTQLQHKEQDLLNAQQKLTALTQELTEIKTTLQQREQHFIAQKHDIEQSKQQLTQAFQNLANQILDEKSLKFSQQNQTALDALLKPFREQIDGFQKRVNDIHSESVKGNTHLENEIKKVLEIGLAMSHQADNLTNALKGEKKTLGNWGEMQLENALQQSGLVENEHYRAQANFKDEQGKTNYPDFVLLLPDNKHIVIDSKMSLIAYESAVNCDDEIQRQAHLKEHVKMIRNHIDDLSRKDYCNLIGVHSPNFVLMFIGIEPAYIEAMKADPSLFGYGYDKNVILVSHTTLMPILRTIANLWRIERGNAEAREISEKAGEIYNQICLVAERLAKLGNTLGTVSNHYNSTVLALSGQQGLIGKVERFKLLSAKASKTMPKIEMLRNDLDTQKLSYQFNE